MSTHAHDAALHVAFAIVPSPQKIGFFGTNAPSLDRLHIGSYQVRLGISKPGLLAHSLALCDGGMPPDAKHFVVPGRGNVVVEVG